MKLYITVLCLFFTVLTLHAQQGPDDLLLGTHRPEVSRVPKGKTVFLYPEYLVVTVDHEAVGSDIMVYHRAPSLKINAPETWKDLPVIFSLRKQDEADYFYGLAEDALLVDCGTSPDRVLKIFDLKSGKKVFDHDCRADSAKVIDGRYLEVPRQIKRNIAKLSRSQSEKYPKVAEWLKTGGSAAWFQKVSIDLKTFGEKHEGAPELLMKQ
ncbi:MAG: hypothetical protein WCP60_10635 [bacterium]